MYIAPNRYNQIFQNGCILDTKYPVVVLNFVFAILFPSFQFCVLICDVKGLFVLQMIAIAYVDAMFL